MIDFGTIQGRLVVGGKTLPAYIKFFVLAVLILAVQNGLGIVVFAEFAEHGQSM
jgi:hypothetical protein